MLIGHLHSSLNFWVVLVLVISNKETWLFSQNGSGGFYMKEILFGPIPLLLNIIVQRLNVMAENHSAGSFKSPWRFICSTIDHFVHHVEICDSNGLHFNLPRLWIFLSNWKIGAKSLRGFLCFPILGGLITHLKARSEILQGHFVLSSPEGST